MRMVLLVITVVTIAFAVIAARLLAITVDVQAANLALRRQSRQLIAFRKQALGDRR